MDLETWSGRALATSVAGLASNFLQALPVVIQVLQVIVLVISIVMSLQALRARRALHRARQATDDAVDTSL